MPKAITPTELYLWFDIGLEPRHLIKLGYSRASVYKYHKRYKVSKARLLEQLYKVLK